MSEASDFDRYDQSLAVPITPELDDHDEGAPEGVTSPLEADPADVADQRRIVPGLDPDDEQLDDA